MADSISVRLFRPEDLPHVLEVLRLSLGEPPGLTRTPDLFTWKHFDNPFGRSLMLVAEEDERIAGFRAFMRWELVGPGDISLRCGRAVDTATHPDFQRRGIFRTLTLNGIEHATAEGMDLIFNTPNENSGAGYLTMGWRRIGAVGVMLRPGPGLLARRRTQEAWEPTGPQMGIAATDRADAFADRMPLGLRTPRSAEYLAWRFGAHPTGNYLFASTDDAFAIGRAHLRRGRRELVVSELAGARAHRAVKQLRAACHPDYTVAWFSAAALERRSALRAGLIPMPGLKALTLMARPLRDLPIELAWSNWDLALGDLELL